MLKHITKLHSKYPSAGWEPLLKYIKTQKTELSCKVKVLILGVSWIGLYELYNSVMTEDD